jgi:hypothetical protein
LLKAEGLKWDDAVKKTFLSNSLNVMLMQALIATSIPALYNEYITLLQQVSHNLDSIQKAVIQERRTTTAIITQQSHMNNMNWEPTEHIIVTATETEERCKAQWVSEKKVTECHTKQLCMHCKDNGHFIKDCKLCLLYNLVSSMLSLLRLWRRRQKKRRTQKRVASSRSHSWECTKCDKSWKEFEKQMNSAFHYVNISQ